jgi:hypothetical protein
MLNSIKTDFFVGLWFVCGGSHLQLLVKGISYVEEAGTQEKIGGDGASQEQLFQVPIIMYLIHNAEGTSYCDRYYCKMCIKTYSQLKNSYLCPFCQGICQCSRCLRNETIFKLRSLYIHLGGRLNELPKESVFEDISEDEQGREIVSKIKKGSPQDQKRKL